MSGPNEESTQEMNKTYGILDGSSLQLSLLIFGDLLDSIIVDVASESHRIAKLGLDPKLEEEEEEVNFGETNNKYVVDIFGQSHPSVASEIFDCMNCGRSIAAGRVERLVERLLGVAQLCKTGIHEAALMNQLPNGTGGVGGEEYSNGTKEEP
ncbi:SAGA-associated factor 11 [Gossypium australe]|uniref:SAGA-associated factor 11 n=1 Tax=Gossypium australe TaxID=47621 RepID=A0A5B6X5P6_9ROSI|nr:SAGA-associated factor 11 [Gossypium australe]